MRTTDRATPPSDPAALPPPGRERRRRRWGSQRSPRQRLAFDVVAGVLLGAVVSAWAVSIVAAFRERGEPGAAAAPRAASVARTVGASLTDPRAASTAYLDDAAFKGVLADLRGES